MANGPNPVRVAFSVYRARRVRLPEPLGHDTADHETLARALDAIAAEGLARLPSERPRIDDYRTSLEAIDPDRLQPADEDLRMTGPVAMLALQLELFEQLLARPQTGKDHLDLIVA